MYMERTLRAEFLWLDHLYLIAKNLEVRVFNVFFIFLKKVYDLFVWRTSKIYCQQNAMNDHHSHLYNGSLEPTPSKRISFPSLRLLSPAAIVLTTVSGSSVSEAATSRAHAVSFSVWLMSRNKIFIGSDNTRCYKK